MATFLSVIAAIVLSIGIARAVVKAVKTLFLSEELNEVTADLEKLRRLRDELARRVSMLEYELTRHEREAQLEANYMEHNVAHKSFTYKRPWYRSEVSIAHPKRLSKGEDSKVIVAVHPEKLRALARIRLFGLLDNEVNKGVDTHSFSLELESTEPILIKLSSQYIDFIPQEGERVRPSHEVISIQFIATPKEVSRPGKRLIRISVTQKKSEESKDELLLLNETFNIQVDDYAFDHVSRPLLTKAGATVSAVAGIFSYALTLLEQIDKTTGLTAGTAFFILLGILASINHILYRRPTTTTVTSP